MARAKISKASVSGAATAETHDIASTRLQVVIDDITTGTGTVTLTGTPAGCVDDTPITDNTIDLSDSTAPKGVLIDGDFDSITATSSQTGDAFTLVVTALRIA